MPTFGLTDSDLVTRRFRVLARDVVYVKSVFEASEGLGVLFGEHGGDLTVATPKSRVAELDRTLEDLRAEIGGVLEPLVDTPLEALASRTQSSKDSHDEGPR